MKSGSVVVVGFFGLSIINLLLLEEEEEEGIVGFTIYYEY